MIDGYIHQAVITNSITLYKHDHQNYEKVGTIMLLRRAFLVASLIFTPLLGYAAPQTPPPAGASAVDVVKFTVNHENQASDATQLLRGKSDKPAKLESLLFTRDFLTAWYAIKAKEAANPDIDNVTNGETDYIINGGPEGQAPRSIQFKDMSDTLNGTMVSLTYSTNGSYSALFFLKQEDGHFKIDDISLEPFSHNNFDPKKLHRPGVSEGLRKDIVEALHNFAALKK